MNTIKDKTKVLIDASRRPTMKEINYLSSDISVAYFDQLDKADKIEDIQFYIIGNKLNIDYNECLKKAKILKNKKPNMTLIKCLVKYLKEDLRDLAFYLFYKKINENPNRILTEDETWKIMIEMNPGCITYVYIEYFIEMEVID
jgi:hypothetical protein